MSNYHLVYLPLSAPQLKRLGALDPVRLKAESVQAIGNEAAGVPVLLTSVQVRRIEKARAAKKGVQIQLSNAQLVASCSHTINGGNVFSDALRKVGAWLGDKASSAAAALAPAAKTLATAGASKVVDALGDAAVGASEQYIPEALVPFFEMGLSLAKKHSVAQLRKLIEGIHVGAGVGSGLYLPGKSGGGLFGPVGDLLGMGADGAEGAGLLLPGSH